MSIVDKIKNNEIHLPIWIGQVLSYLPYTVRPIVGAPYRTSIKEIKRYIQMTEAGKKDYIFQKMLSIVNYAYKTIPFYRCFYDECGFSLSDLKSFDDIERIPIINKDILMSFPIEKRSNLDVQHYIVNTGGSSGKTLTMCSQRDQMAVESAHCHQMYSVLGYRPSDLKMSIVGRNIQTSVYEYDFARHILYLNMYMPFNESATALKTVLSKYHLRFIQGYPSIVSEFATYCQKDKELLDMIRCRLKGVILNSEYPYEVYVKSIEEGFGVPCLSFYGHTERCVLAQGDLQLKQKYYPFQTYGFTEAVSGQEREHHLIGTCYYNYASPLIRYDTEDVISSPEYDGGILKSFEIREGRSGQFILDRHGAKVSLTGLIMGRHHPLFNYCHHIQVFQPCQGKATIIYVPKDDSLVDDISNLVDFSGVDVTFEYVKRREPIRTISGKVNLLVKTL